MVSTVALTIGACELYTSELIQSTEVCVSLTLFPSVPTGAPFRLQGNAINSSALHLSWQPPAQDELNGVLRLYGVTLRDARTGQLSQQNTTTSSIIISSLKPCTTYQCSVEAFTVGFGPASDEYIVQTHPQLSGQ